MSTPIIRPATEEGPLSIHVPSASKGPLQLTSPDVPTILALIHELAAYEKETSSVHATTESLLSTLTFPSNPRAGYAKTLLIAPSDAPEEIAGFALYFNNYSTWRAAPGIYLEDLFVRPQYRGRGYGKRMLEELAKAVVSLGGKRLEWSVLRWNEPSIKFYEGIGAKGMEEWMGMRVDGEALVKLAGEGNGR
jgi:GNAT superfamily N-acetyltransferase